MGADIETVAGRTLLESGLRHLVLAALVAAAAPAMTDTFPGLVVGITDGDTILVLTSEYDQMKVRLAEIDAPEKKQSFGERSKQSLASICFKKRVSVEAVDTDRYGRIVGKVNCEGVNANRAQVESGMAWVYRRYAKDPSLGYAESLAKTGRLGLWADASPTPPWEWRRSR